MEGTCPWCEREKQKLDFFVWYFNDCVFTDWICDRCRKANRAPTVNENED